MLWDFLLKDLLWDIGFVECSYIFMGFYYTHNIPIRKKTALHAPSTEM